MAIQIFDVSPLEVGLTQLGFRAALKFLSVGLPLEEAKAKAMQEAESRGLQRLVPVEVFVLKTKGDIHFELMVLFIEKVIS